MPPGLTTTLGDEQTMVTVNSWAVETTENTFSCLNFRDVKMRNYMYLGIKYWCFCFVLFLQIRIYNNIGPKNKKLSSATQELTDHSSISIPLSALESEPKRSKSRTRNKKGLGLGGRRTGFGVWRPESDSQPCNSSDVLLWGKYLIPKALGGDFMYAKARYEL